MFAFKKPTTINKEINYTSIIKEYNGDYRLANEYIISNLSDDKNITINCDLCDKKFTTMHSARGHFKLCTPNCQNKHISRLIKYLKSVGYKKSSERLGDANPLSTLEEKKPAYSPVTLRNAQIEDKPEDYKELEQESEPKRRRFGFRLRDDKKTSNFGFVDSSKTNRKLFVKINDKLIDSKDSNNGINYNSKTKLVRGFGGSSSRGTNKKEKIKINKQQNTMIRNGREEVVKMKSELDVMNKHLKGKIKSVYSLLSSITSKYETLVENYERNEMILNRKLYYMRENMKKMELDLKSKSKTKTKETEVLDSEEEYIFDTDSEEDYV